MDVDAQTMAGAVEEVGAVTGGSDDVAGGLVDGAGGRAGCCGSNGGVDGPVEDRMDLAEAFGGRSKVPDASHVGGIALAAAADVDEDGVTILEGVSPVW